MVRRNNPKYKGGHADVKDFFAATQHSSYFGCLDG
jgi:hypothetical protein